MAFSSSLRNDEAFVAQLQGSAKLLIEQLQENNFEGASDLIYKLYKVRDDHLYNTVGRLTRALHDAIVNFHVDAEIDQILDGSANSEIRDASDRLQYVIRMTQEAADKTMDRVESAAPIALNLREEAATLRDEWDRFRRREMSKEQFAVFYGRVGLFLEELGESTESLNSNLQAIILEQGYQDLTGQVLKKVINLITDVEKELVNLVKIAGQVEDATGCKGDQQSRKVDAQAAEGPQIHADKREDVVSGQDEVDDLLSSLGF